MKAFTIIYEDDEMLLVHKEAGVCVQGGKGIAHSLDEDLSKQTGYKIHLVHRLDRDTDGILIVAKNPAAASKWTGLVAGKSIKKEYYAWTSSLPVLNGKPAEKGRLFSTVEQHGRTLDAELFFEKAGEKTLTVQKEDGEETVKVYLLHVTLGTGRLHQIRIQLAKAGAPLLADDTHGNFKLNKKIRKCGIKKLQLCAKRLTLPLNGNQKTFEIDFPEHFLKI